MPSRVVPLEGKVPHDVLLATHPTPSQILPDLCPSHNFTPARRFLSFSISPINAFRFGSRPKKSYIPVVNARSPTTPPTFLERIHIVPAPAYEQNPVAVQLAFLNTVSYMSCHSSRKTSIITSVHRWNEWPSHRARIASKKVDTVAMWHELVLLLQHRSTRGLMICRGVSLFPSIEPLLENVDVNTPGSTEVLTPSLFDGIQSPPRKHTSWAEYDTMRRCTRLAATKQIADARLAAYRGTGK